MPPKKAKARGKADTAGSVRVRHTIFIARATLERARNVAGSLAGSPEFLTLAGLLERALDAECARLEKRHNKGRPFRMLPVPLRGGRRAGRQKKE